MAKTKEKLPTIRAQMEQIAGEICDHYCKWPDSYQVDNDEDAYTERLAQEHCDMCPLVQFLAK